MKITIYTDGASRGNPGNASYGFAVLNEANEIIYQEGKKLGIQTNNYAEYTAVKRAFEFLLKSYPLVDEIELRADSKLVIEQLSGRFKIKNEYLKVIFLEIKSLCQSFKKISFQHVPREQNTLADRMANLALDS